MLIEPTAEETMKYNPLLERVRGPRCRSMSWRDVDRWMIQHARELPAPQNARQYFNSSIADSSIVAASITPTTTKTFIFTNAQANQFFPIGYGQNAPFAGQVYHFAFGGIVTTPASGTLIIDPVFGPGTSTTAGGTDLGASPAQTVTASLSSIPFMVDGYIAFRTISQVATTTTAWLTGVFQSQGTLATAGGGWSIPFGSTGAVSVDTTGTGSAGTFGALNFYVTFSVSGATIAAEWTAMQSLN